MERHIVATVVLTLMLPALGAGVRPPDRRPDHPSESTAASDSSPENVVVLIADGMGAAYWTAAKWRGDSLSVREMEAAGLTDTRSSDSWITDSAAGATAFATGRRTYNGAIAVGPECRNRMEKDSAAVMENPASCAPLRTVLEKARAGGKATGLVATSSVTHATPAAFATHVPDRDMEEEIAEQLAGQRLQVMMGGGRGFFDGDLRRDGQNLLSELCLEADCLFTASDFSRYRADTTSGRLVGLFAQEGMPARTEGRAPRLSAMTRTALQRLEKGDGGFFLMVEGSQPDWRGHDKASLDEIVAESESFDAAVEVALEFRRRHPETLVVVLADHETGGLSLHERGDSLVAAYTTDGHTGEMTPHFASGPGAAAFTGIKENREIGRLLLDTVR